SSVYPPMPPADRDHSVEVFEKSGWLYTERYWDSSLGRLHIKQLVAKEAAPDGRLLVVEVTNQGEQDIERLFVEHVLPEGARLREGEGATRAAVEAGGRPSEVAVETAVDASRATWHLARLPAGGKAVLGLLTTSDDARA